MIDIGDEADALMAFFMDREVDQGAAQAVIAVVLVSIWDCVSENDKCDVSEEVFNSYLKAAKESFNRYKRLNPI